jgi:O-antigen ligase
VSSDRALDLAVTPPRDRGRAVTLYAPPAAIAAVIFFVAYFNGGYGLTARTVLAISLWWAIGLVLAFGFLPLAQLPRAAIVAGAALVGLALWTLVSMAWAPSPEKAFAEFNRVSLYSAVFAITAAVSSRTTRARIADGLCIGVSVVAVVALASRLFPHLFPTRDIEVFLPYAVTRLSFPIGYWNGLAILVALNVPLCLRSAVSSRQRSVRALAVLVVPIVVCDVYLASSRGGAITAAVATVIFLLGTNQRWRAWAAMVAGGVGAALALAALAQRSTLVNGPLGTPTASQEGKSAALLIAASCVLAGLTLVGLEHAIERIRLPKRPSWLPALVVALVVVAGIAAAHPVRQFEAFKRPLAAAQVSQSNFATAHLLSGNGSGRWQFWTAAVDQFESAPLQGGGAGTYEYWWSQHASFTYTLKNAHSLYLEILAELGVVGFILLVVSFAAGLLAALAALRRAEGDDKATVCALAAVLAGFVVSAGIDWVWQLTAIAIVGVVTLGLLAGASFGGARGLAEHPRRGRSRLAVGAVALASVWALICAQAIPWLAANRVAASQASVRHGDLRHALEQAVDAKRLEPWAASPYLQAALVSEQAGDLSAAAASIDRAIARDRTDWSVWYIGSRIALDAGNRGLARSRLRQAAALNPRSPLFAGP